MEELPNGFTGFNRRPDGFVSAGEASRISRGFTPDAPAAQPSQPRHRRETAADVSGKPIDFATGELEGISEVDQRWAWADIDLAAVRYNVVQARRFLQPRCRIMATVEADAYGHGAVEVAKAALGAGADRLGVATVQEALDLRKAGISAPILVMSQPPAASIPLLLAHHITPAVYEPDFTVAYGEQADRHNMKAPYQLVLNTGMNHIGVFFEDAVEFLYQVNFHRALELEGIFTEFATSDSSETFDFHLQARRFVESLENIHAAGFELGIIHAADSAALFRFPDVHFDMVRMGAALCGLHSSPQTRSLVELRPAMSVRARIVDIRTPSVSEGVSHGLRYRSPGSVKICTVPLGYADGLRFALSDDTDFIMQGRYYRQVGEICPNHCMFEVDMRRSPMREYVDPRIGDEVIIVGSQGIAEITMDDMAEKLHTHSREIASGFGARLPRVYR